MSFNPAEYTEPVGQSKMLDPGTHFATLTHLRLEPGKNDPNAYSVVVGLEGPDMGDDFEGFDIDKNNQALGKYRGQVADVRNGSWPYSTYTFSGRTIERDQQIYNFASNLAKQLGRMDALIASKRTAETIEAYVDLVQEFVVGATGLFTIAGQQYIKADGKSSISRFFPKVENKHYPFAAATSPEDKPENFLWYDESKHLTKSNQTAGGATASTSAPVSGFSGAPVSTGAADLGGTPAPAPTTTGPKLPPL